MKTKDLFDLIIKVFGFFIVKDILISIPYLFSSMAFFLNDNNGVYGIGAFIVSLLITGLYFAIAYMLIFRTAKVVSALKLEPELAEDRLTFDLSPKHILTIALIVVSGYILIEEIPEFCRQLYKYYELSQQKMFTTKPSGTEIVLAAAKIIIALLIVGERKKIIPFILNEKKEDIIEAEDVE